MVVRGEINAGEGDIAEETGRRSFVQADETEILDDPHGGATRSALDGFGHFALNLKADLDDFERVGEDLERKS